MKSREQGGRYRGGSTSNDQCLEVEHRRHGAFTLIELMVVVVIIGIVTAVMVPEMRGSYQDALLRSSSRKLMDVFNLAYSRAVSLNQVQRVRLDRSTGRYSIECRSAGGRGGTEFRKVRDLPGGEGVLDPRITLALRKTGDDPGPGAGDGDLRGPDEASAEPAPADAITFYPDGTAEGAEVLLTDRVGFRRGLKINPVTARVRLVELDRE